METKFIIKDWAGNVLNFRGFFELPQLAVPMTFQDQDDAFEWIDANAGDDGDLYVDEC